MKQDERVTVHLHLAPDVYARLSRLAKSEGRTISRQIVRAIEEQLQRAGKKGENAGKD